jgi:hypothetical protein
MKRTACILLLALTLLGVSSCDQNPFGDEDDPGNIYSPAIDHLVISRNSVYCGNSFSMTFNFDDKQGDIDFVRVMIIGPRSSALLDEEIDWTISSDVLQGSATVSQSIPCSSDFPAGEYSISVRLVDAKNHVSNQAAGSITLL